LAEQPAPATASDGTKEFRETVARSSVALTADLYIVSQDLVKAEEARLVRIEGKATSLLTASGLSLSVATGFGASTFLAHPEYFGGVGRVGLYLVGFVFVGSVTAGLFAVWKAVQVLLVTEARLLNPADAFRRDILDNADVAYVPPEGAASERDEQLRLEPQKAAFWRQFMIGAHRRLFDAKVQEADAKAALLKSGQQAFFVFLVAVWLVSLSLAVAAAVHGPVPHPSGQTQCRGDRSDLHTEQTSSAARLFLGRAGRTC
jgi:hypothetical protein